VTRARRIVAGLVAVTAILAACRDYMPSNSFLRPRSAPAANQSTSEARHKFSHERHEKILAAQGMVCGDCHRFDAKIDTATAPLAAEASGMALFPGSPACHYCHGPSETRIAAAPSACTTCHNNMIPLMPENHQVAWLRVHGATASADPTTCQNCHRDAFCINCHQNRDSLLTFMHDRNYLTTHSVDARANPIQCGNCHREDFCINCHANAVK
jgi:nitrate/TMAO reductase-like tetraheme cytochrome c subunit